MAKVPTLHQPGTIRELHGVDLLEPGNCHHIRSVRLFACHRAFSFHEKVNGRGSQRGSFYHCQWRIFPAVGIRPFDVLDPSMYSIGFTMPMMLYQAQWAVNEGRRSISIQLLAGARYKVNPSSLSPHLPPRRSICRGRLPMTDEAAGRRSGPRTSGMMWITV
jgi:hypothetical protein